MMESGEISEKLGGIESLDLSGQATTAQGGAVSCDIRAYIEKYKEWQ